MLRDVLIASINKGQFPLAILGLVLIVILLKMPQQDVSRLAFDVLAKLESGYLAGYAFALLALAGWYVHAKRQRRAISDEMERVTRERNKLQEEKLGHKLGSSEKDR